MNNIKIAIAKLIVFIYTLFYRILNKALKTVYISRMYSCGRNLTIDCLFSRYAGLENFTIGNNVNIPHGTTMYSTEANIVIGDNVMFGPNPTIITGDHRINVVGISMNRVYEKLPENDKDVIIEDEVWVGANVTILKGVKIGRGSVIGANSLVVKSCPPYSVVMGVPSSIKRFRFSVDEIIEHEERIYPQEKRYKREYLIKMRDEYVIKVDNMDK